MSDKPKRAGRRHKPDAEKNKPKTFSLPPEVIYYLNSFPEQKRSKVVTNSVRIYQLILEGKVKLESQHSDINLEQLLDN